MEIEMEKFLATTPFRLFYVSTAFDK